MNLQGVVFDTNQGGRLPIEKYLAATLVEREALTAGGKTIEAAASEHRLNAKYLGILWASLSGTEPSLLLDDLRDAWRKAKPDRCRGTGGPRRGLAEVAVELRERRAHRSRRRGKAVDGAGQSADHQARIQVQDSGIARRRGRYDFARGDRCGRRQRSRLCRVASAAVGGAGPARFACCETCAMSCANLNRAEAECSPSAAAYLNAADEISSAGE